MSPRLDDEPQIHDNDPVRILYGRQPMRNQNTGSLLCQPLRRILNQLLTFGIN